ncbi:MAG TPA: hypothetical protein PK772_07725 [Chitinophagaceae bacterium]|nr:hypothetical protein [Chitinophagaceae bacterium]
MSAILIKADVKSNKLLSMLAKQLGANVFMVKDEQVEDLALGNLMQKVKTNQLVSKNVIMQKLKKQK